MPTSPKVFKPAEFAGPAYPLLFFKPKGPKYATALIVTDKRQLFTGDYDHDPAVMAYLSRVNKIARKETNYSGPGFRWSFVWVGPDGDMTDLVTDTPVNRIDRGGGLPLVQFWGNTYLAPGLQARLVDRVAVDFSDATIAEEITDPMNALVDNAAPEPLTVCMICNVTWPSRLMVDRGMVCPICAHE